jgi:hypothetical protein
MRIAKYMTSTAVMLALIGPARAGVADVPCSLAFNSQLDQTTKAMIAKWLDGFDAGIWAAEFVHGRKRLEFDCPDYDVKCAGNRSLYVLGLVEKQCKETPSDVFGVAAAKAEGHLMVLTTPVEASRERAP